MLPLTLSLLIAASQPASASPGGPVRAPAPVVAPTATYADLADLGLSAPVVAHVRLTRALPLRPAEAVGVAAGSTRFYMETEVIALIRGEAATPTRLRYLADLPDIAGRPARPVRRSEYLIFARPVSGRPGEAQLVARDAQLPFSPALAEQLRSILREAASADAPPTVAAIGRAFHTPGTLPGTSETQFFLQTARDRPISITVERQAGGPPRWFVSLSEFVDAGATQPRPGTLLWYRLACSLPAQLPAVTYADSGEHRPAILADYQLVRQGLGRCERLRGPARVTPRVGTS